VLTDVMHLRQDLHASPSRTHTYAVLATYAVFFAAGLVSYVVSLQLFRRFLHRVSPRRLVLPILLVVHGITMVAMYVGRFMRLNSWDVLFAPHAVVASVFRVPHAYSVFVLAMMFLIVGFSASATAAAGEKAWSQLRRLASR
jgi:uncharacterized membrane protein